MPFKLKAKRICARPDWWWTQSPANASLPDISLLAGKMQGYPQKHGVLGVLA
jgi:hypothetical protein